MNRAFLLPTIAAFASGCVITTADTVPPFCDAPVLNLYWTPSPSPPQGGFQVPGLPVPGWPAQLDCTQAGVASAQIFVGGQIMQCTGGSTFCVDVNTWRCEFPVGSAIEGGLSVPVTSGGTYAVRIDGYDPSGNLKYTTGDQSVGVADCGDTSVGIFPQGVAGTLALDYAFTPPANCASGSNIEWTLTRGGLLLEDAATPCGGPNPFALVGGALLPAGVYRLDRVAEVVPGTPPLSVHAICSNTPSNQAFVHAGPEVVPVDLPVSTQFCF